MEEKNTPVGSIPSYNRETSRILAIFDENEAADAAYDALITAGFTDDTVNTFCGVIGEIDLDIKGENHGILHKISQKLHHFMLDEGLQMDKYQAALKSGRCVVQVQTDSRNWAKANEILNENGGRFINYYGLLTTEVLAP